MQHKASGTALKLLTGDSFDKPYLSNAGVEDHAQTVALLHKTHREARDPENGSGHSIPSRERNGRLFRPFTFTITANG